MKRTEQKPPVKGLDALLSVCTKMYPWANVCLDQSQQLVTGALSLRGREERPRTRAKLAPRR